MVRGYIVKAACLLMLVGFASGAIAQIELAKPGVSLVSPSIWRQLIILHAWTTTLSIVAICIFTISYIRHKATLGQWGIWLGFSTFPALVGILIHYMVTNIKADNFLSSTVYVTAYRHAYGPRAVGQHPLDRVMCFTGICRAKNGLHDGGVNINHE